MFLCHSIEGVMAMILKVSVINLVLSWESLF